MYELEIQKIHYFSFDEGWWISSSGERYAIKALEDGIFDSDIKAVVHCIRMAEAGSRLHQLAREIDREEVY